MSNHRGLDQGSKKGGGECGFNDSHFLISVKDLGNVLWGDVLTFGARLKGRPLGNHEEVARVATQETRTRSSLAPTGRVGGRCL